MIWVYIVTVFLSVISLAMGGGGTPGNSWWGCAAQFSKSWPYFRPKNVFFCTHFQTRPLKSIPVFRPGLWAEIMSLLRLERKPKKFSNVFQMRIFLFLSYWFGIEAINYTFIHSFCSLENHSWFQTKMGKVYTRF